MMYWDYPSVSAADRLERAPILDAAQVKLSPAEAWAKVGSDQSPNSTRLGTFDGRPAYFFQYRPYAATVYADTGEQQDFFTKDLSLRTAAALDRSAGKRSTG